MSEAVQDDPVLLRAQLERLLEAIEGTGGIIYVPPGPGIPDERFWMRLHTVYGDACTLLGRPARYFTIAGPPRTQHSYEGGRHE